ncbi:MAG: FIG00994218: hypothetical protein, partial [uncultured Quadrisphaera sp.]
VRRERPGEPRQQARRAPPGRRGALRLAALAPHPASRALRPGQGPAPAGAPPLARPLGASGRAPRRRRAGAHLAPGPPRPPGARADRADDRLAVRVPARHRHGDGRGLRHPALDGHHARDLRRRPRGQHRLLRLALARAGARPQRLRRGPPGAVGVGPAPPGREHLGRRPPGRVQRELVRGGHRLRGRRLPRAHPRPRRAAAARALLRGARPRRARRLGLRLRAAPRAGAGREASGPAHQRPGAAQAHRAARGPAPDRRPAAPDHPPGARRRRPARRCPRRLPGHPRSALGPAARRVHAGRRRAQGGGRGQRRAARLRGAARGQRRVRRRLPPAQAGAALGDRPLRARRLGLARPPGPAGRGVPAGPPDRLRPAAGVDQRGRAAVLRAPVPQHEGLGGPGRHRRRRAARLRGHLRAAAGQGARPHLGGLDDRRVPRRLRQGGRGAVRLRPALRRPDRARPRRARRRRGPRAAAGRARRL